MTAARVPACSCAQASTPASAPRQPSGHSATAVPTSRGLVLTAMRWPVAAAHLKILSAGLPGYVLDNVFEYGLTGALAMVQTQQRGSDSADALSYYSSIIEALQAIAGGAVPAIPAFGSPSTTIAY